ncbi:MAG: T9SS type A sorting domain-containing protein [Bacteroidetes bacterium]|nr:T9SS type A sorting domain-containing protein [Bacteroidota bacterium]
MKAKILTFSLIIIFVSNILAQNGEGNNWIFGTNAGVSWDCSTVTPVAFGGSPLTTNEGVATISDPSCNLLFFSDGTLVWDANMVQMPNGFGLTGDASSTQSAVIIPKPMDPNTYYIFTVDDNLQSGGLAYSRVDMTANGGLGDVDPLEKNIPIFNPSPEKITAVNHANGTDIWVIVHEWGNANFRSILVTSAGIDLVNGYVSSTTGTPHAGSSGESRGYMKASPSGTKVVLGIEAMDLYELFDFDNLTGDLTNPVTMSGFPDAYGCEFSPDEHYLYAVNRWDNEVHQWDLLELPNVTNFLNSHETVGWLGPQSYGDGGAVQLAPDGKIYCARDDVSWLARINEPLLAGIAADLQLDAVFLDVASTPTVEECDEGLPTFITSFFASAEFTFETSCYIDTTFFFLGTTFIDSVHWNFNYPSTMPMWQNHVDPDPWFLFDPGTYIIQCISYNGNVSDTVMDTLTVVYIPWANLGPSPTVLCTNEIIEYDLSYNDGCTFLWTADLGTYTYTDTLPTFLIDKPGNYSVQITNPCGTIVESIVVEYNEIEPNLGVNVSGICATNPITLDATVTTIYGTPEYEWNTGETTETITALYSGTFEITVTVANCEESTSVEVEYDMPLNVFLGQDIELCLGNIVTLDANDNGTTYYWSTGVITQTIDVTNAGTYSVTVTNSCGTDNDNINIDIIDVPDFTLGPDQTICDGYSLILDATFTNSTYQWNDGSVYPSYVVDTAGMYFVYVTNVCGSSYDNILISVDYPISIELGADTALCPGDSLMLDAGNEGAEYLWSNGETTQEITVFDAATYTVMVTNECGSLPDYIVLDIFALDVDLGDDITICQGQTATFDVTDSTAVSYLWSTGENTPNISTSTAGLYAVTIENHCGAIDTDSAMVYVLSTSIELGADTSICDGSTLLLDVGVPGLTYIWSTSETIQAIEVTEAGMYSVTASDPICGDAIGNIIVSVDPVPTVELGFDTLEVEFGKTGIFDAGSGYSSYLWSNGETTQSIEISDEGLYSVIVTNEFGCSAYDEAYLKVGPNSIGENSIENSISIFPNPVKEKLFINSEIAEIEKIDIYNSIGKLIYTEINKSKNIELDVSKYPTGVYFVRINTQNDGIIVRPVTFSK